MSQAIAHFRRPWVTAVSVICALLLLGIGASQSAFGQRGEALRSGQRQRPFRGAFYPPRLVMRYQSEINLTGAQHDSIRTVYARAQSRYHRLKLDLQQEMQALRRLVQQQRVDVDSTQAQLDRVLSIENRLKHIRLRMVAEVKNTLAPEQQAALDTLRPNRRRRPPR